MQSVDALLTPAVGSPLPRDLVSDNGWGLGSKPLWPLSEVADVAWALARGGAAITEGEVLRVNGGVPERLPMEAWIDPGRVPDEPSILWRPWSARWRRWFCERARDEPWEDFCERSAAEVVAAVRRLSGSARDLVVDLGWVTPDELTLFDLPGPVRARRERLLAAGGPPDDLWDGGDVRVLKAGRPAPGSYYLGIPADSVASIPAGARFARVGRGTRKLTALQARDPVPVVAAPQDKHLATVLASPGLRELHVRSGSFTSLAPLTSAPELELLVLESGRRLKDPEPLAPLAALSRLRYFQFHPVALADLASLPPVSSLTGFHFRGGRLESLAPLGGLMGLRRLMVNAGAVRDPSLRALHALRELRHLDLWTGAFPLAEYARLAAALPDAQGTLHSPFQRPEPIGFRVPRCPPCGGETAQTLGRPRKRFCPACEPARAMAYQAEWEALRSAGPA